MNAVQTFDMAVQGLEIGMLAGGIVVLILVTLLIAVFETVILTLLGWEEFKKSLNVSIKMNIASGIFGGILLVLFPQPNIPGLVMAMMISILIEGAIMTRFRPNVAVLTLLAVILANLLSYAVIIFPAYFYAQS